MQPYTPGRYEPILTTHIDHMGDFWEKLSRGGWRRYNKKRGCWEVIVKVAPISIRASLERNQRGY